MKIWNGEYFELEILNKFYGKSSSRWKGAIKFIQNFYEKVAGPTYLKYFFQKFTLTYNKKTIIVNYTTFITH